jgi:hypothetical protein
MTIIYLIDISQQMDTRELSAQTKPQSKGAFKEPEVFQTATTAFE